MKIAPWPVRIVALAVGVGLPQGGLGQAVAPLPTGWVYSLAFSPDGKTLATGCRPNKENVVVLWNVASGERERTLPGTKFPIIGLAYSPDGKTLAMAGGDTDGRNFFGVIRLISTRTWQPRLTIRKPRGGTRLVFSPDGKRLAGLMSFGEDDVRLVLWDTATGERRTVLPPKDEAGFVRSFAFSPDGKILVTAHRRGDIKFWDPKTAKELAVVVKGENYVPGMSSGANALPFSADGKTLAAMTARNVLTIIDVPARKRLFSLRSTQIADCLAFSPRGKTLAAPSGGSVRLWDFTAKRTAQFQAQPDHIWHLAFSPDGKVLAVGGQDQVIRLWPARKILEEEGVNWEPPLPAKNPVNVP